ncbi:MAG: hypothetical protein WC584_01985 [Candidatus Pacearchaeota archaeon]
MTNKSLNLDWQIPKVLVAPIRGASAKELYDKVPEHLRVGIKYNANEKEILGSTPFVVAGLNDVLENYGMRTCNLRDLSLPEVMTFAKNKHYVDSRTLIARSKTDSNYNKNNSLLKTLYELAEEESGSIKGPFMVEGFTFVLNSDDETGYGLTLAKKPDFKVIQDERLEGRYNGKTFSDVDELGLPLFNQNGNRTWYARDNGLSRVYLVRILDLYSGGRGLVGSYDVGRVVVVSAEGTSPKNLVQNKLKKLQKQRDLQLAEINERYQRAEAILKE